MRAHPLLVAAFLNLCFMQSSFAAEEDSDDPKDSPPRIGNFALEGSQQPGPFVSLGQNIIGKGNTQLYLYADHFSASGHHATDILPFLVYGISDDFTINLNFPVAPWYSQANTRSSGLEDWSVQFEYAYFHDENKHFSDQATIMGNMTFPTGSANKEPNTGFGGVSFMLGATYSHMTVNWYMFATPAVILPTADHGLKYGNQFIYQAGIGRNIYGNKDKEIVALLVELDGQYTQAMQFQGQQVSNTGGNVVFITPSIWYSTEHLVFQIGAGIAVWQHWLGEQTKQHYLTAFDVGWLFD